MGRDPKRGVQRDKGECVIEKKRKWIRSANQNASIPRDF